MGLKSGVAGPWNQGRVEHETQSWSETLTVGANIKSFYKSRGNATLTGMNEIATLPDGPEKVVMYDNLTVGDGTTVTTLTASQRCKGLTVIVRGNLTVKNNATIGMTARGARVDRNDDPRFPFIDFLIPNKIGLYSDVMSRKAALELIAKHGFAPWDRGFWDSDGGLLGLNCSIAVAGTVILLQASGCGEPPVGAANAVNGTAGTAGTAGTNGAPGSGGTGGCLANLLGGRPGKAHPYSGGSGSGGMHGSTSSQGGHYASYSGRGGNAGAAYNTDVPDMTVSAVAGASGGGAGNPGGAPGSGGSQGTSGTGGKLVIICYGNITVEAGGKIEANGSPGGNSGANAPGGGGSGGGHISLIYAGTYVNNGTVQCAGGAGGTGLYTGGAGGAGSVVTKTFAQMGWS
jgi:hypothetical protein